MAQNSLLRARHLFFLLALGLPLACSSEFEDGSSRAAPDVSSCSTGYSECAAVCTDLTGDGQNCGACGVSCEAGQVCSAGSCQASCTEAGRTQCDSSCVDVQTNPGHCGACGVTCGVGEVCEGAACVAGSSGSGGNVGSGGTASGSGGPTTGGSYSTEVIIEEGALGQCSVEGIVESDNEGFSGSGYLNTDNESQAGIEWAVDVGQAGTYSLVFTYANGAEDRPGDVLVGGNPALAGVSFPSTSDWTTWATASVDVTLAAGENRIVLEATTAGGLANIDHVTISGAAVNAFDCDDPGGTGGNAGTGGTDGSGGDDGTGGDTGGDDGLADEYPCNAPDSDYDAVVTGSGNSWDVSGSSYASMFDAMEAALGGGGPSSTNKRRVIVRDSGSIGSDQRLEMPNNVVFNVCATIDVTENGGSGDRAPVYARNRSHIDIPHVTITGVPSYGMFFRDVNDLHLGEVNLNLSGGGIGIRIDNNPSADGKCWGRCNRLTNIALDDVYVSGNNGHGVETYGVDGLTIGTVTARDVGNAGLLLNATINATVGTVDGEDVATGNGYATFRVANEAGRIDGSWPAGNIHVGLVRARRGGRGIFCVSDSGGTTIDRVDIADTGGDTMLLENCHNMRVAAESGTVSGSSGIYITQRDNEHTPSSNVVVQNLTVSGGVSIAESKCGSNNLICNITTSGNVSACGANTIQASCP